jgi:sugar/nucleoside kinase (ribokinase family)
MTRLVSVGNVIVDILATVPALPERGGDVLATGAGMTPGGSVNVMLAATRQGLPTAYAGGHGTGFFGDLVREALRDSNIEALSDRATDLDSGYDIVLVDEGGERTFVTVFGAEARLPPLDLVLDADDLLHVSGYGLLAETNGEVLAPWLGGLDRRNTVFLDPGPLVADIDAAVWRTAVGRADWLSCNEREAELITGVADPRAAAGILSRTSPGVLVRLGPDGCLLAQGGSVEHLPGFPVIAIDTNGAGDAHAGGFLAALAAGLDPRTAAIRANACAAIAVTRRGPATSPTLDEVLSLAHPDGGFTHAE